VPKENVLFFLTRQGQINPMKASYTSCRSWLISRSNICTCSGNRPLPSIALLAPQMSYHRFPQYPAIVPRFAPFPIASLTFC
jgi:hypothetical protein